MHPSTSVLLVKGFKRESLSQVKGMVIKIVPFTYFEIDGRTHAINSIGESYVIEGSVWPGPDFTELDPSFLLALAA